MYRILEDRLGTGRVFMDVDDIAPGQDFATVLDEALAKSTVVLALIGQRWLEARDQVTGERRLDNPDDFVRREIEAALERGLLVIPVLVDDPQMPQPDALPPTLRLLSARNAAYVCHTRFIDDVDHVLDSLPVSKLAVRRETTQRTWFIGVAAALLVGGIVLWMTLGQDFSTSSDRKCKSVNSGTIWESIDIENTGKRALEDIELQIVLSDYEFAEGIVPESVAREVEYQEHQFGCYVSTVPLGGPNTPCKRVGDYDGFARQSVGIAIAHFACELVNPRETLSIDVRYASIYKRTPTITVRFRVSGPLRSHLQGRTFALRVHTGHRWRAVLQT